MAEPMTTRTLMSKATDNCRRALEWWLGELRELLQLALRAGGGATLEFGIAESGEAEPESEQPSNGGGKRRDLRLRLDQRVFLYRKIKLPAAARKSVRRVIEFEFNKYFPMNVDDALFSCSVLPAAAGATSIEIEIWAIGRALVDRHLARIVNRYDLRVRQLELANLDGRVLVTRDIDRERRLEERRNRGQFSRAMNITIAGLLTALVVYPVNRFDSYLERQREEIVRLEKRAAPIIELRRQTMQLNQRFDALVEDWKGAPNQLSIWSYLTATLGDRVTLDRLEVEGNRVRVIGQATSVEALLRTLEKRPRVADIKINGPVKATRDGLGETMNLTMTVED